MNRPYLVPRRPAKVSLKDILTSLWKIMAKWQEVFALCATSRRNGKPTTSLKEAHQRLSFHGKTRLLL